LIGYDLQECTDHESAIAETNTALGRMKAAAVTEDEVCQALTHADRIFAALKPLSRRN
jgi:hypothetical protein